MVHLTRTLFNNPTVQKTKKIKKKLKKKKIKKPSHITCKLTTRSIGRFSPKTM